MRNAIQGQTWLRITILDAPTLRVFDPSNRFAVGVGETIYNQTTHYATADFYANTGEQQYSRVTGAHFELFARLPFRAARSKRRSGTRPRCSARKSRRTRPRRH